MPLALDVHGSIEIRILSPDSRRFERVAAVLHELGLTWEERENRKPDRTSKKRRLVRRCTLLDDRLRACACAVDRWKNLLATLSEAALSSDIGLFGTVWMQATEARQECVKARRALIDHMRSHGCAPLA
ncbi:MAG: hypothetical protein ACRD44_16465 [Bryobacteraceae bacterium]